MKRICLVVISLLPFTAFAQTTSQQSFFDKYEGKEGFTSVKISPKMFNLIASADINDEDLSAIKDITGVNVLAFENEDGNSAARAQQLYNEAKQVIGNDYDELMSVKDDGTDLKILAHPSTEKGVINDLLIVGNDDGEFVYVDVRGKIDVKKISSLSKCTDIKGMDELKKL